VSIDKISVVFFVPYFKLEFQKAYLFECQSLFLLLQGLNCPHSLQNGLTWKAVTREQDDENIPARGM
jgi:hypothetical protein